MSAGWEKYSALILSAFLPFIILILFWPLRQKINGPRALKPQQLPESGFRVEQTNARFYTLLNCASILGAFTLLMIPCVAAFRSLLVNGDRESVLRVVAVLLVFTGLMALAVFYASRKGDLTWLRSYQRPKPGVKPDA
jgi:hypothetical protein